MASVMAQFAYLNLRIPIGVNAYAMRSARQKGGYF